MMKRSFLTVLCIMWVLSYVTTVSGGEVQVSEATQECLDCHSVFHPGIVEDWRSSRHAQTTPKQAMAAEGLALKVSSKSVPEALQETAVGCAECHTLRNEAHADAFDHNEVEIHVVVSPDDCATCHVTERTQFDKNIMAHARKNLAGNPVYQDLQRTILGESKVKDGKIHFSPANELTRADACFYCHGTKLEVIDREVRDTDAGELEFPVIKGWPNQGVGRVNLDGSKGACSACHTRHQFSIETARKPYTCKECHVGPDVPAFKVYTASKHGNIFSSMGNTWNFKAVPWTVGQDFTAPTCAACHVSLLVNTDGEVVNKRTHQMSDRLGWRIFGVIYAHPHPKDPDITKIRNSAGLPLPTDFDGKLATDYLIDSTEQESRRQTMQQTCLNCHDTSWVKGYFERLDNTIKTSNAAVLTATNLVSTAWEKGYAQGLDEKGNPFDEFIERRWTNAWLLYANNIRFVSAMAGGGDYGVFEDGRYHLTNTLMEMQSWIETRDMISGVKKK